MNKLINIENVRLTPGWLVNIAFYFCGKLEDVFWVFINLMLMTWRMDVFLLIIFLLILIFNWFRMTLVGAIRRHITILYFKRLAAYIIFLDTKAS